MVQWFGVDNDILAREELINRENLNLDDMHPPEEALHCKLDRIKHCFTDDAWKVITETSEFRTYYCMLYNGT